MIYFITLIAIDILIHNFKIQNMILYVKYVLKFKILIVSKTNQKERLHF